MGKVCGRARRTPSTTKAEKFVLNAINNDPEAESFTEHLATKWLKARKVIPLDILAKRDAEALAEAVPEADFEKFGERDASPEAEPEAAPEAYLEERDAEPESEPEADPKAYFGELDAYPEA